MYRIVSVIASSKDWHSCIENIEKEIEIILPGKCKVFVKNSNLSFDETLRQNIINDEKELSVAMISFEKGKPSGFSTDILPFAKTLYVPLKGASVTVGVLSFLPANNIILSNDEKNMLFALANQLAIYLEKELFKEKL